MARIQVTEHYNALNMVESRSFEWVVFNWDTNPERAFIQSWVAEKLFGKTHFARGEVITLGTLRLRCVDSYNVLMDSCAFERDGLHARWTAFIAPVTRTLDIVYRRMVITAVVWRLAKYHEAAIPTWRDVYALDRAAKFWHKWVMLED